MYKVRSCVPGNTGLHNEKEMTAARSPTKRVAPWREDPEMPETQTEASIEACSGFVGNRRRRLWPQGGSATSGLQT